MTSNWFELLSNAFPMAHILTLAGLLLACLFGALYLAKRKPDYGLLMVVCLLYAFTPLVHTAMELLVLN